MNFTHILPAPSLLPTGPEIFSVNITLIFVNITVIFVNITVTLVNITLIFVNIRELPVNIGLAENSQIRALAGRISTGIYSIFAGICRK